MQFVTHNLDGKAGGAIALVVGGVSVVIGKEIYAQTHTWGEGKESCIYYIRKIMFRTIN